MGKPKTGAAWSATLAAAVDLFAFVFLAKADASLRILLLFAACELVLIIAAIRSWQQYFEELIDFKVDAFGNGRENQPSPGNEQA